MVVKSIKSGSQTHHRPSVVCAGGPVVWSCPLSEQQLSAPRDTRDEHGEPRHGAGVCISSSLLLLLQFYPFIICGARCAGKVEGEVFTCFQEPCELV